MTSISEWLMCGGLLALIGLLFKVDKDGQHRDNRIYERFDEYKKGFDDKHVSKEVCGILHKQIVDDLKEIKADVKTLVKNGNK